MFFLRVSEVKKEQHGDIKQYQQCMWLMLTSSSPTSLQLDHGKVGLAADHFLGWECQGTRYVLSC